MVPGIGTIFPMRQNLRIFELIQNDIKAKNELKLTRLRWNNDFIIIIIIIIKVFIVQSHNRRATLQMSTDS